MHVRRLQITLHVFFCYRKTAYKAKHNIIHLNLSIALLFGLITFVSGIQTATGSKVRMV